MKKIKSHTLDMHEKLRYLGDLRIVWNFSFLSKNKYNFKADNVGHKALLTKMEDTNKYSLIAFLNLSRKYGLELLNSDEVSGKLSDMKVPDDFGNIRKSNVNNKWFSIRYSSSGRIIGKMIDNTFYVFWVDPNHELYKG